MAGCGAVAAFPAPLACKQPWPAIIRLCSEPREGCPTTAASDVRHHHTSSPFPSPTVPQRPPPFPFPPSPPPPSTGRVAPGAGSLRPGRWRQQQVGTPPFPREPVELPALAIHDAAAAREAAKLSEILALCRSYRLPLGGRGGGWGWGVRSGADDAAPICRLLLFCCC